MRNRAVVRLMKHLLQLDEQDVNELVSLVDDAWMKERQETGDTTRAVFLYNLAIRLGRLRDDMREVDCG